MESKYNLAILGATGIVGETILDVLAKRKFPVGELYLLASQNSAGKTYRFNGKTVKVQDVDDFDWSLAHIGLFSAGRNVSAKWAEIAAQAGVVVIDNTSHFRYEHDIPLVIPEVNPDAIAHFRDRNIIANPNCSTIQMLMAIKPIYDAVGIERINVASYQSVSGVGRSGIEELAGQTAQLLNGISVQAQTFTQQIAFNCIPQIDALLDNGYSKEEMKMVWETQKILGDHNITVNPTCVRVPVFYGHAEALHIETTRPIDADEVIHLLENTAGVSVFYGAELPTQVLDATGNDDVMVGRIRNDISHHNGINMWVVADNIRKGAATNAVQIAEILIRDYY